MKNVFTKKWLDASCVRAIRTFAQTAVGVIGASTLIGDVNWVNVLSASLLAALMSVLMSTAGLPELKENTETDGEEDA